MSAELDKFVYDLIIQRTIDAPKKLLELLSLWPHELYNSAVVVELLQQKLGDYETEAAKSSGSLDQKSSEGSET